MSHKDLAFALTPSSEIAKDYINPVHDDTWVRHTEFTKLDKLKELSEEMASRDAMMRDYAADKRSSTALKATQPQGDAEVIQLVEGMEWKDTFMKEYKQSAGLNDRVKAVSYKNRMMDNFRKKQQTPQR